MYQEWRGDDPVKFVWLANAERRHLTPGQKAFAALETKRFYAGRAKENQRAAGQYDRHPEQEQLFENFQKAAEQPEPVKAKRAGGCLGPIGPILPETFTPRAQGVNWYHVIPIYFYHMIKIKQSNPGIK